MSSIPSQPRTTRHHEVRPDSALLLLPSGVVAATVLVMLNPGLLSTVTDLSEERLLGDLPGLFVRQWAAELVFFWLGVLVRRVTHPVGWSRPYDAAPNRPSVWTEHKSPGAALRRGSAWMSMITLHVALLSRVGWLELLPATLFILLGYWFTAERRRWQHVIDKRRFYTGLATVMWMLTSFAFLTTSLEVTWDLSVLLPLHDPSSLAWQTLYVGSTAAWVLAFTGYWGAVLARLQRAAIPAGPASVCGI